MAAASSLSLDAVAGQRLTAAIQAHLGQLLGAAYAGLPDAAAALPPQLTGPLDQLTAALAALTNRDERAFRSELEALIPNLFRFAMTLTKNASQADDLLQDTLLRAWRARARFEIGTNLGAWLFTIMRNAFYSSARKSRETSADEGQAETMAAVPSQLDSLDVQDVQRALARLSEPMRRALVLVTVEGLSYEATAEAMNCQVGTVKSRVSRAREQLCVLLGYGARAASDQVGS